ncbi:MAG: hypothetical protein AAF657_35960, partial [Acidobacteriota bacterium]
HLSRASQAADPARGAELALLAVGSLAANRMIKTHPELAALARERLAEARRRAAKPEGPEEIDPRRPATELSDL